MPTTILRRARSLPAGAVRSLRRGAGPILTATALASAIPGTAARAGRPDLDKVFKDNKVSEDLLHAREIPVVKDLAGAERPGGLRRFLPSCEGPAAPYMPSAYAKEYVMPRTDADDMQGILRSIRKYSDVGKALDEGYRVSEEYETGVGVPFANPKFAKAGKADWSRPALLFYVKARGRQDYRLVGTAYIAAGAGPPAGFHVAKASTKKILRQWRPWNGLCFKTSKGRVVYSDSEDGAAACEDGVYFKNAWVMHVWLPLFNPKGLFTPRNPIVDYLDLSQKPFSFCHD